MAYLGGVGSLLDPYRIHNPETLKYWFENEYANRNYAVLVNNIDMYGLTVNSPNTSFFSNLDGYGFTISNLTVNGSTLYIRATWTRVRFKNIKTNFEFLYGYNDSNTFFVDVIFDGVDMPSHTLRASITRTIFMNLVRELASFYAPINGFLVDSLSAISKFTDLRGLSNKYDSSNYPGINGLTSLWLLDGSSSPRLIPQSVTSFVQAYVVKGVTKVGGQTKQRRCRAHAAADFNEISNVVSGSDGSYLLNCGYYDDQVYVTHSDDYGRKLMISKAYVLGEYIHPVTPNGYRYKCTTAGTSAATPPPEPWPTSSNLVSGTAIFTPEPVYKAETFLVVPKLFDLLTGQPV